MEAIIAVMLVSALVFGPLGWGTRWPRRQVMIAGARRFTAREPDTRF